MAVQRLHAPFEFTCPFSSDDAGKGDPLIDEPSRLRRAYLTVLGAPGGHASVTCIEVAPYTRAHPSVPAIETVISG